MLGEVAVITVCSAVQGKVKNRFGKWCVGVVSIPCFVRRRRNDSVFSKSVSSYTPPALTLFEIACIIFEITDL